MSQRNLRLVSVLGNAITFADPLHVSDTTRFTQSVTNVNTVIGLVSFQRAEMASLRNLCVKPATCADGQATTMQSSVRLKVNSPIGNSTEVKQQVLDALENFRIAINDGLLEGLKPTTNTTLVVDYNVE